MADGSVGSVFLDLVVRDTVDKQVQAMAEKAQATTQKSFAGMEQAISAAVEKAVAKATKAATSAASSASRAATQAADAAQKAVQAAASSATSCGQQVENTIGQSFSKSVAIAQSKVAQLEKAFDAVTYKLDGQWYSGAFDPASKATQKLLAEQEKLMAQLEAAQDRLAIEVQAAAQKRAAAEEAAAQKAAQAEAREKAKQEAAAQKASAAAQKAAQQAAAAQEREARKNEAAQQKAAQAAAKAHEQSAARMKNAFSKAFSGAKKMAGGFGKAVTGIKSKLSSAGKSAGRFGTRLKSIISGALVFNLLSSALRKMTDYLGTAIGSSSQMKDALANLKGAAMTAAQPIVEMLTPALTALANGAATVLSYLTRLISFFTGKTVSSMSSAAKKIQSTAGAAKKAMGSLAGFDEIQKLDSNDSPGGGGGAAEVEPNFNFQGQSSFLDSVMESVKGGNWSNVGALVSEKLNSCLSSINWPSIQQKASTWISGIAQGINGFVQNLDFSLAGSTISNALNTLVGSIGTFFSEVDWKSVGSGFGSGISSIFFNIDWEQFKTSLTAGFNGILDLITGITSEFIPLQGIDFSASVTSLQGLWDSVWDFAELVGGTLAEVYDTVMKPILGWVIEDAIPASVDVFTAEFDALSAILKPVKDGLDGLMEGLDPVIKFIEDTAMVILDGLKSIFEKLAKVFTEKGDKIQNIISGIGEIIGAVWKVVKPVFDYWKEKVAVTFEFIGNIISTVVGTVIDVISGVVDFVAGVFTGDWERAWDGIVGIFDGIVDGIKGTINSVIGFINGLISGVCDGINTIIRAMNKLKWDVPDWVPILGGKTFGFNLSTITAPQIPMLANGGVITQPTLAMMGEYPGAKSNPEIAAPKSLLQETMAEVLGDLGDTISAAIVSALAEMGFDFNLYFTGDLAQLGRLLKPVLEKENRRVGTNILRRGSL
ncbi:MAG: hypothetical protein IKY18_04105 [Oscillospiraceae bacterium]|nr:hypothetical protein [Oscillospiraceae bacterium]